MSNRRPENNRSQYNEVEADDIVPASQDSSSSDSGSVDSDHESLSRQRIYYNSTPEHRLYRDRRLSQEAGDNEPPVLWIAKVYNADGNSSERPGTAAAIYLDDRPLEISLREKQRDNEASGDEEDRDLLWTECVFEVSSSALAHFPVSADDTAQSQYYVIEESTSKSRGRVTSQKYHKPRPPPRRRLLTSQFGSLKFERASRNHIWINSPYLLEKLRDFAGYYPTFFWIEPSLRPDQPNPNRLVGSRLTGKISDPWGILFHRFQEIEAFVQIETPKCETQDNKLSKQERKLRMQREHVSHLYRFLKPLYDSRILPCRKALEQTNPELPFDMLWYAFAPGIDVYLQNDMSPLACVVIGIRSNLDDDHDVVPRPDLRYWEFELWYLNNNRLRIGRASTSWRIYAYSGLQRLTSLKVCPTDVWDASDNGERRMRIMRRSKLLERYLRQGHLLAWHDGPTSDGKRSYAGRVVIDSRRGLLHTKSEPPTIGIVKDFHNRASFDGFKDYDNITLCSNFGDDGVDDGEEPSYMAPEPYNYAVPPPPPPPQEHRRPRQSSLSPPPPLPLPPAQPPPAPPPSSQYVRSPTIKDDLTDHQLFLLCPNIHAFALKTKEWLIIQADNLSEVASSDESIANLVLDEAELRTLRALSTRQNSQRDIWAADFIEGKGTGQIVLLHGPPGVGKTYTVEAIAELLNRPLLSLTVADIGTAETRIEHELLRWFMLAEAWNAVLLVDEADIFLERRQNRDLARNGLVSAFLRRMEYFKGLLFLTTNRVGQIDDAFISRIHVAIGYKPLTADYRVKIWQGFFRKLIKERPGKIQISQAAKKWVLEKAESGQAQMNGRDIRNALQTAITLAEAESEEDPDFDPMRMAIVVDQSHFEQVLDISNKFHEYVKSIRREDEKKRAAALEWRNDYWKG